MLILILTKSTEGRSRVFYVYPREGYRSVTPPDAARVNRRIFHHHSVHRYNITRITGRDYIKYDIIWHGQQNPRRGRGLELAWYYYMIWLTVGL